MQCVQQAANNGSYAGNLGGTLVPHSEPAFGLLKHEASISANTDDQQHPISIVQQPLTSGDNVLQQAFNLEEQPTNQVVQQVSNIGPYAGILGGVSRFLSAAPTWVPL